MCKRDDDADDETDVVAAIQSFVEDRKEAHMLEQASTKAMSINGAAGEAALGGAAGVSKPNK